MTSEVGQYKQEGIDSTRQETIEEEQEQGTRKGKERGKYRQY